MPTENGLALPQAQQVHVCAWRIKYRIHLPVPMSPLDWEALAQMWPESTLQLFPLPTGQLLYKLTLPEKAGTLTGSVGLDQLYAVLMREGAEIWLSQVLNAFAQLYRSDHG